MAKKSKKVKVDTEGATSKGGSAKASPVAATPRPEKRANGADGDSGGGGSASAKKAKPVDAADAAESAPPAMDDLDADGDQGAASQYSTPASSPQETAPDAGESAKALRKTAPNMTIQIVIAGSEPGMNQVITFVAPAGANLSRKSSWKTFMENNRALLGRMTGDQLSMVAESKIITADAPCSAGVTAAIVKLAGIRFKAEMAAARTAWAAEKAKPEPKDDSADNANVGANKTALLQNLGLVDMFDPDTLFWTELEEKFDGIEETMAVSTAGCNAEQRNEMLLQATGKALAGSAAAIRAGHTKKSKQEDGSSKASYEELRGLIITTYKPNDADIISFQELTHFGRIASRYTQSQTLVACFEQKYAGACPNGVDTGEKYDHKTTQFVVSVLNCFPRLMAKLKGKKPKAHAELVEWFHLQFVGGVIPVNEATVGAIHCRRCSGYHFKGQCRLGDADGTRADRTIDRQENRRNQYRRPAGSFTNKQVAALDERADQAYAKQETTSDFNHSIAALAGQFNRQNEQRNAARDGGGRGRERGRGRGRERGRGRGAGRDRYRDYNQSRDEYDNTMAREVQRQINALGFGKIDMGEAEK